MVKRILAATIFSTVVSMPQAANKHTEEQCLSSAIYYEARGESIAGRRAVLDTIYNRMKARKKTACEVVKEPFQFSWTRSKPMKKYDKKMQRLLHSTMQHSRILLINEKFFFSTKIKRPKWARKMACRQIGNHVFCKRKERK